MLAAPLTRQCKWLLTQAVMYVGMSRKELLVVFTATESPSPDEVLTQLL